MRAVTRPAMGGRYECVACLLQVRLCLTLFTPVALEGRAVACARRKPLRTTGRTLRRRLRRGLVIDPLDQLLLAYYRDGCRSFSTDKVCSLQSRNVLCSIARIA